MKAGRMEVGTFGVLLFVMLGELAHGEEAVRVARQLDYTVMRAYDRDASAFTQGLVVHPNRPDTFIESNGIYGQSDMRRTVIETGEVQVSRRLGNQYFGEGITIMDGTVYQLTWKENTIFVYPMDGMFRREPVKMPFPTGGYTFIEGWGITNDGTHLIVSDGTAYLYFLNPNTWTVDRRLTVMSSNSVLKRLNELEFVERRNGGRLIYANVWYSNNVYAIDYDTGEVEHVLDLKALKPPGSDVLNGIAYDKTRDRLYVTGKYWNKVYWIREN
mmetsp:Transcript_19743/g.55503  ORF Transcript_19743/g.55503 Transcript_19743/m.55503 type:complete len:272 (+) Transcript_19743:44-859(+)|eukprot:CAMPEP_0119132624 /NCGR_PEP_ID=MMETSP1310-20130426/11955_1 /TAXON_ID=464262 /ORGANISM="Genus nov. species nov., Strain RCC2339" /LENGTH=271 /DNA_ID=CAMNT_0007123267 /DNA_START=41 /DNA_END=856 /DNA_ORIENTATION=+